MSLFRRGAASTVDRALATMLAECRADEREQRGTYNRPRYMAAKRSIRALGKDATEPLLEQFEHVNVDRAAASSPEKHLAEEIVALLGETRDPRAVPTLESLLPGIWASLTTALAKTDEGTQVLLDGARSPDRHRRAQAMGAWSSDYRPAEVLGVLVAGLSDADLRVRGEALLCVMARNQAERPLITELLNMRASDEDEKLRDRADTALHKLGVL